jgi:polar amino acid transport system permease protein
LNAFARQLAYVFPRLLPGLWTALELAIIAIVISAIAGLGLALLRNSRWTWIRWLVAAYVEVLRDTPLLVQMFFFFFGLPLIGLRLSPFQAAALSLATQHAAFFAEVYRGGFQSVSRRHKEAAKALGMGYWKTLRLVTLPLAVVRTLPAISNELVQIVKDTSVASTIAVMELTLQARTLAEQTAATSLAFVAVAIYYLVVTGVITVGMRALEQRLRFAE